MINDMRPGRSLTLQNKASQSLSLSATRGPRGPPVPRLGRMDHQTQQLSNRKPPNPAFAFAFVNNESRRESNSNHGWNGRVADSVVVPTTFWTPSGCFETNTKVCLSVSAFHPELRGGNQLRAFVSLWKR